MLELPPTPTTYLFDDIQAWRTSLVLDVWLTVFFECVPVQALWDTGSQVTIINEEWKNICFPHIATRKLTEVLDEGETLIGRAANQTDIPFSGCVELKFQLGPKRGGQAELLVPVLLSSEQGVDQPPIIGYNVIQQLVTKGMEQYPDIRDGSRFSNIRLVDLMTEYRLV